MIISEVHVVLMRAKFEFILASEDAIFQPVTSDRKRIDPGDSTADH
jgi:hypothetical protein